MRPVYNTCMHYLGVISIVIIWLGLLYLINKWPGKPSMSFSLHATQTKGAQIYYFLLFLVSLPLFYIFIVGWYVPSLHLNSWFVVLTTIGVIGQLIAATVPAVPGRKTAIHNIGAYGMAATFIPLSLIVAMAGDVHMYARVVAALAVLYMICTLGAALVLPRLRAHYIYFQAGYIAAFHAVILTSAYL